MNLHTENCALCEVGNEEPQFSFIIEMDRVVYDERTEAEEIFEQRLHFM